MNELIHFEHFILIFHSQNFHGNNDIINIFYKRVENRAHFYQKNHSATYKFEFKSISYQWAVKCWMLSKYNVHCERPWPLWAWGSALSVWISRRPLCTTESKLALGWRPPHNQSQHRHFRWPHDYWGASLKVHKGHPAEYPLFQPGKNQIFNFEVVEI